MKILSCFDSTQFRITLHTLTKYLSSQKQVSLVVCDSPAAFYWPDQLGTDRMTTKHKYLYNMLSAIFSGLSHHHVILVYTVSDIFISPTFKPPIRNADSKHHRVDLKMLAPCRTIAEDYSTPDRERKFLYEVTVRSPDLPEHRVHFRLNSKGIPLFIEISNISTEKR
ncbi:hypothetical protein B566_EDAN002562 [Ephemera danica]|nr:hypothetical protein B566_EDAN002562 [Ephemera danica]